MITLWSSDVGAALTGRLKVGYAAWIMFGMSAEFPFRLRPSVLVESPKHPLIRVRTSWLGVSVLTMLTVRVVGFDGEKEPT